MVGVSSHTHSIAKPAHFVAGRRISSDEEAAWEKARSILRRMARWKGISSPELIDDYVQAGLAEMLTGSASPTDTPLLKRAINAADTFWRKTKTAYVREQLGESLEIERAPDGAGESLLQMLETSISFARCADHLDPIEQRVLELVVLGYTDAQIASVIARETRQVFSTQAVYYRRRQVRKKLALCLGHQLVVQET